jgi:hypothetical protein
MHRQDLHVEHRFVDGASLNTRVQVRCSAGYLNYGKSGVTGQSRTYHTSRPQWMTPRRPYVMHGAFSVIHVELLTRTASIWPILSYRC